MAQSYISHPIDPLNNFGQNLQDLGAVTKTSPKSCNIIFISDRSELFLAVTY